MGPRRAPAPLVLLLLLLLAAAGCAHVREDRSVGDEVRAFQYPRPLSEYWPRVQRFFHERGFRLVGDGQPPVLMTDWREHFHQSRVAGFRVRYAVVGFEQPHFGTQLRVYRYTVFSGQRGPVRRPGLSEDLALAHLEGQDYDDGGALVPDQLAQLLARRPRDAAPVEKLLGTRSFYRDTALELDLVAALEPRDREAVQDAAARRRGVPLPTAPLLDEAAAAAGAAALCGAPVLGAEDVLRAGSFVLLGEVHGTREVPDTVARLACHAAYHGQTVVVGLEIPEEEQPRLERFLASAGQPEDRLRLLNGRFWHRPYQDGRSSQAVLALLDSLRTAQRRGLAITAVAYDGEAPLQGTARDAAMAHTLATARERLPGATFLVLTGNRHARKAGGAEWDRGYRPLALQLRERGLEVTALDLFYRWGSAWGCLLGKGARLACGAARMPRLPPRAALEQRADEAYPGPARRGGYLLRMATADLAEAGFDGVYYVPFLEPSPPAATGERLGRRRR